MKRISLSFLITVFLVTGILGMIVLCNVDNVMFRPSIYEISVEPTMDGDGPAIMYRYSVSGREIEVILKDEADLKEYKAYLARFGDFK